MMNVKISSTTAIPTLVTVPLFDLSANLVPVGGIFGPWIRSARFLFLPLYRLVNVVGNNHSGDK